MSHNRSARECPQSTLLSDYTVGSGFEPERVKRVVLAVLCLISEKDGGLITGRRDEKGQTVTQLAGSRSLSQALSHTAERIWWEMSPRSRRLCDLTISQSHDIHRVRRMHHLYSVRPTYQGNTIAVD